MTEVHLKPVEGGRVSRTRKRDPDPQKREKIGPQKNEKIGKGLPGLEKNWKKKLLGQDPFFLCVLFIFFLPSSFCCAKRREKEGSVMA